MLVAAVDLCDFPLARQVQGAILLERSDGEGYSNGFEFKTDAKINLPGSPHGDEVDGTVRRPSFGAAG